MKQPQQKKKIKLNLISSLLYLLMMALLISLGFWQLGRAEEKQQLLDKQHSSVEAELVDISEIQTQDIALIRYRKTSLKGQYDPAHQFLIDNQIVNGRVGYYVLTPFKIHATKLQVLVNRGWLPLNKDRRKLPDLSMKQLSAEIQGRLNAFPSVGIKLDGAEIPTQGWPSVVQLVDTKILAEKLGATLLPYQVELAADMPEGYLRQWKKNSFIPPEKHIAYAVQWFVLALTLTVLFLWYSRKESK